MCYAHREESFRRARRVAARRTFTRGSADFARARVLAAFDLLSWLDQRSLDLRDLTQADLDRWLTDGTSTRRAPCSTEGTSLRVPGGEAE